MAYAHDGEFKLDNPPDDCIQSVKFGKNDSQHLLTANWDTTVRLYNIKANQLVAKYNHDAPVLDASFQGDDMCWSVGADEKVKRFDFTSQNELTVGSHTAPVRSIEYVPDANLMVSGSWDSTLKLWDPRLADFSRDTSMTKQLPDKVYTMSACKHQLIIGLARRLILIYDLRKMEHIQRESLLKYQTRCIATSADERGYVVSSIEGRVAVEYLDPAPEIQQQRYAFKCHRNKDPTTGKETIHPVNTVSFHRKYNTFATGGSDGYVSIWDGKMKKRLVQYHRYPESISSLSFSPDGSTLAIACSYQHTAEETFNLRDTQKDCIFIRRVNDHEVKNKC